MRLDQREKQRHDNGCQQIGFQGIGREGSGIPAQLARDDGSSRGRGAYQAHHDTFKHAVINVIHRTEKQKQSNRHTGKQLEKQQPQVPLHRTQVTDIYLAEGQKQLRKNESGRQHIGRRKHKRLQGCHETDPGEKEIAQDSEQHSHRKCPVLQKLQHVVNNLSGAQI